MMLIRNKLCASHEKETKNYKALKAVANFKELLKNCKNQQNFNALALIQLGQCASYEAH